MRLATGEDYARLWSTQEVADALGVTAPTIRNWVAEFGRHLSERVRERQRNEHYWFTGKDVDQFRRIYALTTTGYSYELIHARLGSEDLNGPGRYSTIIASARCRCRSSWQIGFGVSLLLAGAGLVMILAALFALEHLL